MGMCCCGSLLVVVSAVVVSLSVVVGLCCGSLLVVVSAVVVGLCWSWSLLLWVSVGGDLCYHCESLLL